MPLPLPPVVAALFLLLLPPLIYYGVLLPWHRARCRRRMGVAPEALTVAFFHPYWCVRCAQYVDVSGHPCRSPPVPQPTNTRTHSNAGGGGERVLWLAIKALAALHEEASSSPRHRPLHVVIYAGAEDAAVGGAAILAKAEQHFGVQLRGATTLPVSFAFVRGRPWLEARRYPVFTMLGQSAGSVLFALACLAAFAPDVWLDTTGCAFTYPVAALLGRSRVAAYVHYPTISTDMLSLVREQRPAYNNDAAVAGSGWRSRAKLLCVPYQQAQWHGTLDGCKSPHL